MSAALHWHHNLLGSCPPPGHCTAHSPQFDRDGGRWGGETESLCLTPAQRKAPEISCSGDHIFSSKNQTTWCDLEMHRDEKMHRGRKIKSHLVACLMRATNKLGGFILIQTKAELTASLLLS